MSSLTRRDERRRPLRKRKGLTLPRARAESGSRLRRSGSTHEFVRRHGARTRTDTTSVAGRRAGAGAPHRPRLRERGTPATPPAGRVVSQAAAGRPRLESGRPGRTGKRAPAHGLGLFFHLGPPLRYRVCRTEASETSSLIASRVSTAPLPRILEV